MGQLSSKLRHGEGSLTYWCQGCEEPHSVTVNPGWGWNGDVDRPTFTPSVHVTSGHFMSNREPGAACWCSYNAELVAKGEPPSSYTCSCCHTFITDGMVQFLGDCTHPLAGQTLPLPDLPPHLRD